MDNNANIPSIYRSRVCHNGHCVIRNPHRPASQSVTQLTLGFIEPLEWCQTTRLVCPTCKQPLMFFLHNSPSADDSHIFTYVFRLHSFPTVNYTHFFFLLQCWKFQTKFLFFSSISAWIQSLLSILFNRNGTKFFRRFFLQNIGLSGRTFNSKQSS